MDDCPPVVMFLVEIFLVFEFLAVIAKKNLSKEDSLLNAWFRLMSVPYVINVKLGKVGQLDGCPPSRIFLSLFLVL